MVGDFDKEEGREGGERWGDGWEPSGIGYGGLDNAASDLIPGYPYTRRWIDGDCCTCTTTWYVHIDRGGCLGRRAKQLLGRSMSVAGRRERIGQTKTRVNENRTIKRDTCATYIKWTNP